MVVDFDCSGLAATINKESSRNGELVLTILVGSTIIGGQYMPAESASIYGHAALAKLRDALIEALQSKC